MSLDEIAESLDRIFKRLDLFDLRLRNVEERSVTDRKILLEEDQTVAGTGDLGGKETVNENGVIKKITAVKTCDCCGDLIQGQFVVCTIDKIKCCPSCTCSLDSQKMCKTCLMRIRPLSKPSFKVLMMVYYQIDNLKTIHDFTKIPKNPLKGSIAFLFESGYVMRKGLSGYKITESGTGILTAYRQIFGQIEDVITLEREVKIKLGL